MSYETELELAARRLEGENIERVHYRYAWDAPVVEESRLAVIFELANRIVEVEWADDLGLHHGFHIALREVTGFDEDRGRLIEVTDEWRRDKRLARIARASIEWGDVRADLRSGFAIGVAIHSDYLRRADYPRALVLKILGNDVAIECRFTNSIAIVAAELEAASSDTEIEAASSGAEIEAASSDTEIEAAWSDTNDSCRGRARTA